MQLIRVRYYPATNTRGARLIATNNTKSLTVSYQYGNDDQEKLEAAQQFVKKFMPYASELDPIPGQFKGDNYYHFAPKTDTNKLEDLISEIRSIEIHNNSFENITLDKIKFFKLLNKLRLR